MVRIKSGEVISWKEFFKRWGKGIKNVVNNPTPQERLSGERNACIISLIGYIACLITLLIFHDKFFVTWFAYGLIVIFLGSIYTTGLKFFGARQQLRMLKEQDANSVNIDDLMNKVNHALDENHETTIVAEGKETNGMSTQAMEIEKYVEEEKKDE